MRINWNPLPHLVPVPINWYGLNWILAPLAFVVGFILVRRWSDQWRRLRTNLEALFLWIAAGSAIGARLYCVVQNEPLQYFLHSPMFAGCDTFARTVCVGYEETATARRLRRYSCNLRNRSALPITDTELKVMAALAMMGLSKSPKNGYSTPAAIGTPSTL